MTLSALYKATTEKLVANGIDDAALEARLIIENILGISYSEFLLKGNDDIADAVSHEVGAKADRRIAGEPVQYILGEWDFMGFTFKVGQGVLIPRPETEILCEYVLEKIRDISNPTVYDLCSGSGCIGISIKKYRPDAKVILIEKSDEALKYLSENSKALCADAEPVIIQGDILKIENFSHLPEADVIISNPPYIRSNEIPTLQREVQREPTMALDGGEDGLIFYRVLINDWSKKLKADGFMAFECGEDQSEDIMDLFEKISFDSETIIDYNNIQRIVTGRRKTDVI